MKTKKEKGKIGEKEVIRKVRCPNCRKKFMLLPVNYPLADIQCTACHFRAQVKTISSKPRDTILGAGWEIINKTLKSGYLVPSLLANFKWDNHQEIRFYPFIPKINLEKYQLSPKARQANYKMFH